MPGRPPVLRGFLRRLLPRPARPRLGVAEIAEGKARVEAAHGPWTAHNPQLAPGLATMRPESVNFDEKTRRCVRLVQGFVGADLAGLRVLDLGAGEGGLALEFAAQGARVVCVEGRLVNTAKVEFVASALGLEVDVRRQDVRDLDEGERHDVALCFGLLYHLDAASAVRLLERIGRVTERLLVLDTHFSLAGGESVDVDGRTVHGHTIQEHTSGTSAEAKAAKPWASLDNDASFWLSKPSLLNTLGRAGFDTVFEVAFPLVFDYWDRQTEARVRYRDRATFVAVRTPRTPMRTVAPVDAVPPREVPEDLESRLVTWTPPSLGGA